MGVALGRALVEQAQLLRASAQGQVAARDLRLGDRADPQQLSDYLQVGDQVVVAELHAEESVPVPDHGPGWLEGQRMVDRGGAAHQLAGHDGRGDGRDLLAEDLDHRDLRVEDARHHEALALEELGRLHEITLLEDQDPLVGPRRELRSHERSSCPGAHDDHVGLQHEAIGAAHDPGGLEAPAQGAVGHDAAPQDGSAVQKAMQMEQALNDPRLSGFRQVLERGEKPEEVIEAYAQDVLHEYGVDVAAVEEYLLSRHADAPVQSQE